MARYVDPRVELTLLVILLEASAPLNFEPFHACAVTSLLIQEIQRSTVTHGFLTKNTDRPLFSFNNPRTISVSPRDSFINLHLFLATCSRTTSLLFPSTTLKAYPS
jgi:hypothetical protein